MKSIGVGVKEIRVRDSTGAFRVIYVAKFEEAVYVLHRSAGKKHSGSGWRLSPI